MKKIVFAVALGIMTLVVVSCKKQTPPPQPQTEPVAQTETPVTMPQPAPAAESKPAESAEKEPLPLVLPKPQFVGTPENLMGIANLDKKPDNWVRPPFLAPKGVTNIALNKPVTGSELEPIMGELKMITDGDAEATDGSVVEMGPFTQWVQVDLETQAEIYAIVLWHFHKQARVYFDVVVQVSDDPEFVTGVTTLFNNDTDNTSGLGVGTDKNYLDDRNGLLVNAKGIKGRYVRCTSNGNNSSDLNHYIEVQVFGKK